MSLARLERAGLRLAQRRAEALAAQTADRLEPVVTAGADGDRVVLSGRGLAARLFGTRRRGPDLKLWRLIGGWR